MANEQQSRPNGTKPGGTAQSDDTNEKAQPNGAPAVNGANAEGKQEQDSQKPEDGEKKAPPGGFSDTTIPSPPSGTVGYTLKITFHRAINLAMGDAHVLSSDPYLLAQLNSQIPTRHNEDPPVRFRTATVRRNTNPEWNEEWIIANVPSSGFRLKVRVYDEDPADHDDLLGKVRIDVPSLSDGWDGIHNQRYRVLVRDASKRALMIRAVARCFRSVEHMKGELFVSIEMLGRTGDDGQNGRLYTAGPCRWIRHYSPMLGRLAHIKEPDQPNQNHDHSNDGEQKTDHYDFQANQMQLQGPVPPELYHRFVEFKPWVQRMFSKKGFQGAILGKVLHHQHERVYNFSKSTLWGFFPQGPCQEMTQKFLDLVHWDKGGRIFTYVITLDALWRFTETGKEFGIDMLSKHTMHSDVSIYIAFSGEFFIRRLKHKNRPPPPEPADKTSQSDPPEHSRNEEHPPDDLGGGPPDEDPPKDPAYYQLVIDNDSGTYRPNAKMLPILAAFLAHSLPGLHILTLDCTADADKMSKMKSEQRDKKAKEGDHIVYAQGDDSSSLSSSDDERLERQQGAFEREGQGGDGEDGHGALSTAAKDAKRRQQSRMDKMKRSYGPKAKGREEEVDDGGDGA